MALKKPSIKGVIVNSIMLLTSFLIGFLVLEFVFARFYYSDVMNVSDTQYHPTLGWVNRPGSYVVKPPNGFQKHSIEIDELGLRTLNSDPGPDARQLVVLGDSFTYGKVTPTSYLLLNCNPN